MKKKLLAGAIAALAALSPTALAADHGDGPGVLSDPSLDITDIYTWTDATDKTKLNLIMDLVPNASKSTSQFSNTGQYVFNLTSYAAYGAPLGLPPGDLSQLICMFDNSATQKVSCWLVVNGKTADYVTGDASAPAGIPSVNGDFLIFTGPRQDPFFFNLDGFNKTLSDVQGALPDLIDGGAFNNVWGAAGCPTIDDATLGVLGNQLATAPDGSPAVDHFAGFDVLSIVVQIKSAALTPSDTSTAKHPVIAVWGSTRL